MFGMDIRSVRGLDWNKLRPIYSLWCMACPGPVVGHWQLAQTMAFDSKDAL
jgi:hypothetical protein